MGEKQPRPFTLLDAMVVIASTAVGLAGIAFEVRALVSLDAPLSLEMVIWLLVCASPPMLACWSIGWLALRLRQPRPAFPELMVQPGMAACTSALCYLLISSVPLGILASTGRDILFYFATVPYLQVGTAVISVWLVQALGQRWKPEASWLDRSGRLLGVSWILWTAGVWVVYLVG